MQELKRTHGAQPACMSPAGDRLPGGRHRKYSHITQSPGTLQPPAGEECITN
jgi:hypothetical protein